MSDHIGNKKSRFFLPDPDKWINTSAKKSSSGGPQRPLVGFPNTTSFSTPTPAALEPFKSKSKINTEPKERQAKLDLGFFTPGQAVVSDGLKRHEPNVASGSGSRSRDRSPLIHDHDQVVHMRERQNSRLRSASASVTHKPQGRDQVLAPPTRRLGKGKQPEVDARGDSTSPGIDGGHGTEEPRGRSTELRHHVSAPSITSASSSSDPSDGFDEMKKYKRRAWSHSRKPNYQISARGSSHTPTNAKGKAPAPISTSSASRTAKAVPAQAPAPTPAGAGANRYPVLSTPQLVHGSPTTHATPTLNPYPPPQPSSDRPITPVPAHVLDIHRQLCGRDPERMRRVKSPWADENERRGADAEEEAEVSRKIKAGKQKWAREYDLGLFVDPPISAAAPRPHGSDKKRKAPDEAISSKFSTPTKKVAVAESRGVLSPLAINTLRKRGSPSLRRSGMDPLSMITTPASQRIAAGTKRVREKPVIRQITPSTDTSSDNAPAVEVVTGKRSGAPSPPTVLDPGRGRSRGLDDSPIVTPRPISRFYDISASLNATISPVPGAPGTPTPSRVAGTHHQLTPSKQPRSIKKPTRRALVYSSDDDVSSPPCPVAALPIDDVSSSRTWSKPSAALQSSSPEKAFQPAAMDAETLLTWSLGVAPRKETSMAKACSSETGDEEREGDQERPGITPIQRARADQVEGESMAPSVVSQSFPRLLPSPPAARSPVLRADIENRAGLTSPLPLRAHPKGESYHIEESPAAGPSVGVQVDQVRRPILNYAAEIKDGQVPTQAPIVSHKAGKKRKSSWPSFAIEASSSKTDTGSNANTQTPSVQGISKNRRIDTPRPGSNAPSTAQAKLAAFGFFAEKSEKVDQENKVFTKNWDEEEDHDFDVEGEVVPEPEPGTGKDRGKGVDGHPTAGLQPVPDAPFHPSLRPAGIAELKARQARYRESSDTALPGDVHIEEGREGGEEEEEDEPLFAPPATDDAGPRPPSTDSGSSFTTTDEERIDAGLNSSVVDWWDGIAERRSSEFGSFRE